MKYAVHVYIDTSPLNPWEDWDFQPPMVVIMGRDYKEYDFSLSCPKLPEAAVRKHWKEMLAFLTDYPPTWQGLLSFARDEGSSYPLWEVLADAFTDKLAGEYLSDRIEQLKTVYGWLGMPAVVCSASGYSQGDYIEALLVATPEWRKQVGNESRTDDEVIHSLELDFKTYAAYAFGDVYGWVIAEHDGNTHDETWDGVPVFIHYYGASSVDEIESCWGYYGRDHEESGLRDSALDLVRYLMLKDAKRQEDEEREAQQEASERLYWESRDVVTT